MSDRRAPALTALVAVLALVCLELVRSSGPLFDMAFAQGVVQAAGAALVTYALPGPLAWALVRVGRRRGLSDVGVVVAGALVLGLLRLALPLLTAGVRFAVGLLVVAWGLAVLVLAVAACARRVGGPLTLRALAGGLALQVSAQLVLGTWDATWRTDLAGWAVTVLVVGLLVVTAARTRAEAAVAAVPGGREVHVRRLWALGPLLALVAMALANPAFAASQSGAPLAVAGPVTATGLLFTAWLVGLEGAHRTGWPAWAVRADRVRQVVDAVALALLTAVLLLASGPWVLVALVAVQLLAVQQAALALRVGERPASAGRTAAAATAVGLGTILPLLVFQLDYDVPLGFPNALVAVAAAALLGAAGLHRSPPVHRDVPRRPGLPAAVAAAAVLVGSVAVVASSVATDRASAGADHPAAPGPGGDVVVVSWNVHYGVTPAGHVRLEELARTVEEQGACVVLLQEVSRGWVMGGGADMATWLAHRLDMRMAFAPAADRQFGNAVLACAPLDDVVVHELPYGQGPQGRSAISATVASPVDLRVTSVHLQHREASTPTRLAQIDALLAGGDLGVVGGDLNAEPGWEEIDRMTGSGFTSAQDAAGDPDQPTSPSLDPQHRIDWVFVPAGVQVESLEVLTDATWSDHLALAARLSR